MSNLIGNLPPPYPNAALTLTKAAGELQVRENLERVTDTSPEARSERRADAAAESERNGTDTGPEQKKQDNAGNPNLDVTV